MNNKVCPSCGSKTEYSVGLHRCTVCSYAFLGRRPALQGRELVNAKYMLAQKFDNRYEER